jgi:hypothetical protein
MRLFAISLFLFVFTGFSQNLYVVKDKQGNVIIETDDINLVQRMKNVKIDTLKNYIHLLTIKDSSSMDEIKDSLLVTLGKPKRSEYNYRLEWQTADSGQIVLIKPRSFKPALIVDSKGEKWVNEHLSNFMEIIKKK